MGTGGGGGEGRGPHGSHAVAFRSLTTHPGENRALFLSEPFLMTNRSLLRCQIWLENAHGGGGDMWWCTSYLRLCVFYIINTGEIKREVGRVQ